MDKVVQELSKNLSKTVCCATCRNWIAPENDDEAIGVCTALMVAAPMLPRLVMRRMPPRESLGDRSLSLTDRIRGGFRGVPNPVTERKRGKTIVRAEEVGIDDEWDRLRTYPWFRCARYDGEGAVAAGRERGAFVLVVPGVPGGPEGDDPGAEAVVVAGGEDLARPRAVPAGSHQLSFEEFS